MKQRVLFQAVMATAIMLLLPSVPMSGVPQLINYQGRLTDSLGVPLDATIDITFTVYDDSIKTNSLWSETHSSLSITDGVLSVLLGSVQSFSDSVFNGSIRWLGMRIGPGPESENPLPIVSVAYALKAIYSDTAAYSLDGTGGVYSWTLTDSVLYTNNYWGIARGGAGNILYGSNVRTHVNLGVSSTTGTNGMNYQYSTVGGGNNNTAGGSRSVVAGGESNIASGDRSVVSGGESNIANGERSSVSGGIGNNASGVYSTVNAGYHNTASGFVSTVCGGHENLAAGNYSTILGGYRDTITSSATYSYLFGINSKLTQPSTFMIDMPHIRFGDETNGYEFPNSDGNAGQVMSTNGSGQLSWINPSSGGDYVLKSGDEMTGDLSFDGLNNGSIEARINLSSSHADLELYSNGIMTARVGSEVGGELWLSNGSDGGIRNILVADYDGGELALVDENGAAQIYMDAGNSGDNSVHLPDDAISATEMLNEPGIAQALEVYLPVIDNSTVTNLLSASITVPASGYIVAKGYVVATISGTVIGDARFGIGEWSSEWPEDSPGDLATFGADDEPLSTWVQRKGSVSLERTFYVSSPGTYWYFLNASRGYYGGTADANRGKLTLTYIPTSYGPVSTLVSSSQIPNYQNSTIVTMAPLDTLSNNIVPSFYRVDLRDLELKAVTARAEAEAAERKLLEAKLLIENRTNR